MQPHSPQPKEFLNIILATVTAVVIIYFWQTYMMPQPQNTVAGAEAGRVNSQDFFRVDGANVAGIAKKLAGRKKDDGVPFENAVVKGSLSFSGGRLDDIFLKNYRETADKDSDPVHIMIPENGDYFIETGYSAVNDTAKSALPGKNAVWKLAEDSPQKLTASAPVILVFENAKLRVRRTISMAADDRYLFRYTDTVENLNAGELAFSYYAAVDRRIQEDADRDMMSSPLVHEGVLVNHNGKLEEFSLEKVEDKNGISYPIGQAWTGITDHYWLTAVIPPKGTTADIEVTPYRPEQNIRRVQTGFIAPETVLAPGDNATFAAFTFAGAKELDALDRIEDELGAVRFDRAIDFGWVYFISKPLFILLDWLRGLVGNFGLAIIAVTCLIRLALFPLAQKSYIGMQRMKDLQPKIMELREKHKDDAQQRNAELMKLYQREKVNPVTSGCLPMLLQLPVFFALYKVFLVAIEMRHAPFYGWITDLAAPDPSNVFTLFGLIAWNPPSLLHIGVLPLLVGITMYIQQRLSPQPMDATQAKVMRMLPFLFVFVFAPFPAGLVLYWFMSNLLSIMQQAYIKYSFAKKNITPTKA